MNSSDRFWKVESLVFAAVLSRPSKIAICPFGEKGMIAKWILNERYGLHETYILDSKLPKYNPKILTVEALADRDTDGLIVIMTADNREINDNLTGRLKAIDPNILIINYMDPQPCALVPYKYEFFKQLEELLVIRKPTTDKEMISVGGSGNGSYVLMDNLDPSMHLYSFGIDYNTLFDEDIVRRWGMESYLFDHTIDGIAAKDPRLHFYKTGISGIDEPENDKLSLKTIVSDHGDIGNKNLLLKMDVEGAEWEALAATSSDLLGQFTQIAIEFHDLTDMSQMDTHLDVLKKLNKTHQIVYKHDTVSKPLEKARDISMPMVFEATYLNREKYRFEV